MKKVTLLLTAMIIGLLTANASPYSYNSPADGFYTSFRSNFFFASDSETDATMSMNDMFIDGAGETEWNMGWGVGATFGYRFFDSLRIELDYSYRTVDGELTFFQLSGGSLGTNYKTGIDTNMVMFNIMYDFNFTRDAFGYVGLGLGMGWTNYEISGFGNDTQLAFAYQLMAGVGYRITTRTSLIIGYKLATALDQDYEIDGNRFEVETPFMHNIELGIRYDF